MKKTTLFIILVTVFVGFNSIFAQTPVTEPNYDLAERFSAKKVSKMVFSTSVRPNWFKNSNKFWYVWQSSEGTQYYIVDPVAKTKKPIFDMGKLAMELTEIIKDPYDAQHIPIRNFQLKDDKYFTFEIESTQYEEPKPEKKSENGDVKKDENPQRGAPNAPASGPKKKKVFKFEWDYQAMKLNDVSDREEEKAFPRWASFSPDTTIALYVKGYDLYYTDMANIRKFMADEKDSTFVEHRLTTDGTKFFAYGGSNSGSDEVDTTKRTGVYVSWSPDSKHFAMVRSDVSKIKDLWVINVLSQPRPTLETYKYQMPGEPGAKAYLQLFNMETKSSKMIKIDAFKDQTVTIGRAPYKNADRYEKISKSVWLGDNEKFYVTRSSRDLKRIDICTVNVNEDSCKVVIEERLNTYIELRTLRVVNNGKELIQWSERNGWAHLYLYDSNGNLKNPITNGTFHVGDVLAVNEAQRVIYFTACGVNKDENPYYTHTYKINFDGSGMTLLNPGDYDTRPVISEDGKFFVNNYSRVDLTPATSLIDGNGKKVMDLETADLSQLMLAGYKFPEIFKVKAGDGITDLFGVMYKPFDFDSTKIYPLIEYVYPGPQTEANNSSWSAGMDRVDRLAQLGFIVITVGNRGGHPDRSKWYHNYGYGNLRDYGLEDKKVAAQQLAARYSFIDGNKVGIHGHSGGGFMSTAAILKYPDFFKVAVSCAGNHDNSMYNRWWSETHHGVLEEITAKGDTTFKYSIDKNQALAGNLKGHLLLIHGDIDNNVHPGNTMRVVDALIKANKRFDMLILPGQRHSFGNMTEYFFWKMADYFSEHLIGTSQKTVDIPQMNNN